MGANKRSERSIYFIVFVSNIIFVIVHQFLKVVYSKYDATILSNFHYPLTIHLSFTIRHPLVLSANMLNFLFTRLIETHIAAPINIVVVDFH